MDANRLRFWMLADPLRHWEPVPGDDDLVHLGSTACGVRLADSLGEHTWQESGNLPALEALVDRVPGALDAFGTWAWLDTTRNAILAAGAGAEPIPLLTFEAGPSSLPTDLAVGSDDVLYVALGGGKVLLRDLRNQWEPTTVSLPGFAAWRLAAAKDGGVFAIQRPSSISAPVGSAGVRIARISGLPLPRQPLTEYAPKVFRPTVDNPNPPRMSLVADGINLPGEVLVSIASSPEGRLALLSWIHDPASAGVPQNEAHARIRLLKGTLLSAPIPLKGARRPYSFAWLSNDRLAVLMSTSTPNTSMVVTYTLGREGFSAAPRADYYPLTSHDGGPFLHPRQQPPHYPVQNDAPAPLYPVSLPSFTREGKVRNATGPGIPLIDAGSPRAVWHRLYLEAAIPPGCGIRIFLATTNTPQRPAENAPGTWYEHRFGDAPAASSAKHVPRGVWLPTSSELPFHPGLIQGEPEADRRGLFTALIQRAGRRVRSLQGRYLWVRAQLIGDGRSTPELAALRVHGPRFSYVEHYLPELYREQSFGPDADALSDTSTPSDFLERFLGIAEGVLTPLEDRIASAALLTDPRRVPEESLEWLASWIGLTFDQAIPPERRRKLLEAAPRIRPWRGTLRGLSLTLDALTGGAVSQGGLVIVEEFRLRRTFSTILGINLNDEDDPLLPGLHRSGNSFVGDTLFLGDERRKEFLALFGEELPKTGAEEAAVDQFFEQLAHRVTVLVHQDFDRQELGLIQRVAELEAPAYVSLSVKLASYPLMVGVASLVGIDTYLEPPSRPKPVRVGGSALGSYSVLERPPSLDPRLQAGV
jgi:phage tail-like protein